MMHDASIREIFTTILLEVGNQPRLIKNQQCLRLLSELIRFVLTLFVHEESVNFRLLYVILDSSSYLYYLGQKRRKIYLY